MVRGRGGPRGGFRGSRGSSWGGSRGSYMGPRVGGYGGRGGHFDSSPSDRDFDSRSSGGKYGSSDRFQSSRPHPDDYHKSYRSESSYMGREGGRRSPDRKRMRMEGPGSRHESSYGGGGSYRHEGPPPSGGYGERGNRSYSDERHGPPASSSPYSTSRREPDFRSPRGSYRGRSRGRGGRDRIISRKRLIERSYTIRRRGIPSRISEFSRRARITKMRSVIARKKRRTSEEAESGEEKEKKDENEKAGSGDENAPDNEEKDKKSEDDDDDTKPKKKVFVKLHCPHCGFKALTFHRYDVHLNSRPHLIAMRRLAFKQKSILASMRKAQRSTQNELEKDSEDLSGSATNFCPVCKLNYKVKKTVHQLSESHKNMKKFLMPTCKVCSITFKSPMSYETHLASINHMKRKHNKEHAGEDSGEDNELANLTTIDSVGGGDEGSDAEGSDIKKEDKKEPVNVGVEQIRKIEAHYCDLCRMYLPRGDEEDMPKIIAKHCRQRIHMHRYVRYKERQALEKRAEKLQRKEMAEKEKQDGDEGPLTVKKEEGKEEDDKLWADVDKDLGDILAEAATGNKSSDEDEDDSHINGERYDRFKLSEKMDDDKIMKADEETILDNKPELKEKLTA